MPVSACLDYCIFVVSFEVKKYDKSNLLLFETVLTIYGPLHIHINFRISLSIFAKKKKPSGILIEIALNV